MAIPIFDEMFYPCLKFLSDGKSHKNSEFYTYIENYFSLTKEEINTLLPSKTQKTYQNRACWCIHYLYKAKLIERNSKGVYQITNKGKEQFNTGQIDSKACKAIVEGANQINNKEADDKDEFRLAGNPDEEIGRLHNMIISKLADELLERVYAQTPQFFEKMVV